jgi:lactate dehydrogenase-like 2-hydroxyacid dehydrogenase
VLHHTRNDTGVSGWTASLDVLARAADVLSVHVPLTSETQHLISADVLGALSPSAVLINTSRGSVVDETALADALDEGRLWGAGLDVYVGEPTVNPRLLAAPHTVLLPHVGSATVGTRRAMCELAIDGALAVLDGRTPANLVTAR